jgi:proline iminopeptidase
MFVFPQKILLFKMLLIFLFSTSCTLESIDESQNLVPPTVDQDLKLPRKKFNEALFHLETFGDIKNPILIFIPGGPGTDFAAFLQRKGSDIISRYPEMRKESHNNLGLNQLQDQFFTVFFDPRGAGLSPRYNPKNISLELYHEDLKSLIDTLIAEKFRATQILDSQVVLLGHSFGGLYATSFVNQYPQKVQDVVLFEPAPLTQEVNQKLIQTSVFAQLNQRWLNEYLYSLDHISYDSHAKADFHRILGFTQSFPELAYPDHIPIWRYGAFVNQELEEKTFRSSSYNITENLANFKGRALFIWGSKTTALNSEGIALQMKVFPRVVQSTITNAGHYMIWENPDECIEAIRNFLNNPKWVSQ